MPKSDKQGKTRRLVPLGQVRIDDPDDAGHIERMGAALAANADFAQKVAEGFVPIGSIPANASPEELQEFSKKMGRRIADMGQRGGE